MYKKVCTPIVQYKRKADDYYDIYDISIVNHKNEKINLFHASENENAINFPSIKSSYGFIKKLLSMYGYRLVIVNNYMYNIQWINLDNYKTENYKRW